MALRVAFMGTPSFAVASLEAIARSKHQVVAVVTQPDRPRGRGQKVMPSPVKQAGATLGIPILQPERLKDDRFMAEFAALRVDIGVVAAYGKLLPQALLDIPRLGMINVHASLLPRWRGAAPIHRAVIAGDSETGITIMKMVLALDAGPMLMRATLPIGEDELSSDVEKRLSQTGAELAVRALDEIEVGTATAEPQDDAGATYADRLLRRDGLVDWREPARNIHNKIRGLHPWPLVSATIDGVRVKLLRSRVAEEAARPKGASPGEIIDVNRDGLTIASGSGAVVVTHLQPEGKSPMAVRDYLNGKRVNVGTRVEPPALPE